MLLKSGVKIQGISTELLFALNVAGRVYESYGHEVTITSLLDGKHSKTSLHYSGNAADLRTRDLGTTSASDVRNSIKERLGIDYDVILETDHIHVEYQPRRP